MVSGVSIRNLKWIPKSMNNTRVAFIWFSIVFESKFNLLGFQYGPL